MEKELSNIVTAVGNYNEIPTSISSLASVVTMIDGLTINKVADKSIWADGLLTYTITINNQTSVAYTSPVISDVIDTSLVEFVTGSVTIDGTTATTDKYSYDSGTSTLKVTLEDIAPSAATTVTFQVKKKD